MLNTKPLEVEASTGHRSGRAKREPAARGRRIGPQVLVLIPMPLAITKEAVQHVNGALTDARLAVLLQRVQEVDATGLVHEDGAVATFIHLKQPLKSLRLQTFGSKWCSTVACNVSRIICNK